MQGCDVRILVGKDAMVEPLHQRAATATAILYFSKSSQGSSLSCFASHCGPECVFQSSTVLSLRKFSLTMTICIQYGTIFTS